MKTNKAPADAVRVCVIDLGTNSFHAVVVDLLPGAGQRIVDKLKITVDLASGLAAGALTLSAVERGRDALSNISILCRRRQVEHIRAYATSAIREADNGQAFTAHIQELLDLTIQPISGEKEARMVWRGVASVVDLEPRSLIMDIGGGSTEFVIADNDDITTATSLTVGAGRMTQQFFANDPPTEEEVAQLEAHLERELSPLFAEAREMNVARIVGSSGTMENLCELAHSDSDQEGSPYQRPLAPDDVLEALDDLITSTPEERAARDSLDPHRREQIIAGAVLLRHVIRKLEPSEVLSSRAALREGMVLELADDLGAELPLLNETVAIERRHFLALGVRHRVNRKHAEQVASLSSQLFDLLQPLHGLDVRQRELLEYAALVHDVGHVISGRRHHKHGRYIVEQARWPGIPADEVARIALLVRYHRRGRPKKKHPAFGALSKADRREVRQLAAILRLADGLDRSHTSNVTRLHADLQSDRVRIVIETTGDPDLELRASAKDTRVFEKAFGRVLEIDAAWQGPVRT